MEFYFKSKVFLRSNDNISKFGDPCQQMLDAYRVLMKLFHGKKLFGMETTHIVDIKHILKGIFEDGIANMMLVKDIEAVGATLDEIEEAVKEGE